MDEQSELIYGEIVAIGRVLNDERFAFRQFSSHLKIYALQNDGKNDRLSVIVFNGCHRKWTSPP